MNDFVRELSALPLPVLLILGLLFAALVLYAVLGGADYGGGVWDLLAFGPRAREQRRLIETAIGPVWEANHVWLIFMIVLLFTAFPSVFAALSTALHIPLTLMLLGIVVRGTSFTFRQYDRQDDSVQQRWGRLFAISSVFTPVMLGICIGAISTGGIGVQAGVVLRGGGLDESPHVYRRLPEVLAAQEGTIDVLHVLRDLFLRPAQRGDRDQVAQKANLGQAEPARHRHLRRLGGDDRADRRPGRVRRAVGQRTARRQGRRARHPARHGRPVMGGVQIHADADPVRCAVRVRAERGQGLGEHAGRAAVPEPERLGVAGHRHPADHSFGRQFDQLESHLGVERAKQC